MVRTHEMPVFSPPRGRSEAGVIEEEFEWLFESKESQNSSYEALNPLYQIQIHNNIP